MGRISGRGKLTSWPKTTGRLVAPRIKTIVNNSLSWDFPRQLWLNDATRPGGTRPPLLVFFPGSPHRSGTNATPSSMDNASQISNGLYPLVLSGNDGSFPYAVSFPQFAGGGTYPADPLSRRAAWAQIDDDIIQYGLDGDRGVFFMGHSGGAHQCLMMALLRPERTAGVILLDGMVNFANLGQDAAYVGGDPDGNEMMDGNVFTTDQLCWDEYIRRAGDVPQYWMLSEEWYTIVQNPYPALGTYNDGLIARYAAAGKTFDVNTTVTNMAATPTISPSAKRVKIRYSSYTTGSSGHQLVMSNGVALTNTQMYGWMAGQRRPQL